MEFDADIKKQRCTADCTYETGGNYEEGVADLPTCTTAATTTEKLLTGLSESCATKMTTTETTLDSIISSQVEGYKGIQAVDMFSYYHELWSGNQSGVSKVGVFDCLPGGGKTQLLIEALAWCKTSDCPFKESFHLVYSAETIEQLLEVILRLRQELIKQGWRSDNANTYFQAEGRLAFNFDGSSKADQKRISNILNNKDITQHEKNFLKSLKCETAKFKNNAKMVFTTHQSLLMHADFYYGYHLACDEVPSYGCKLTRTRHNAAKLTETHINLVNMAGEEHIDPMSMSYGIASGLVAITDLVEGESVLYHLNDNHPFKSVTVLTAFAPFTSLGVLSRMNKNIHFYQDKAVNTERMKSYQEHIFTDCLDIVNVTNADSVAVKTLLHKFVYTPSNAFIISTSTQGIDTLEIKPVRTNKTGINSLGSFDECLVATQLNLNDWQFAQYKKAFGLEAAKEIENGLAGSKLLQSIFRGSIRRNCPMHIVFCSKMCKYRVLHVLACYGYQPK
jgi:hypothetical protein